jgi:large subunit ribosomal protein L20
MEQVAEADVKSVRKMLPYTADHRRSDMSRVKRGVTAKARHKKILGKAKGYYGARSTTFRVAKQAVIKAGQYAYRDRRQRKRQFRALWITRINAAARLHGLSYSRFISGLQKAGVEVDRKVLADVAVHDADAFGALAEQARQALAS